MHIIISNTSDKPIYEQVKDKIKELIIMGELQGGEMLPSIRNLAKDLRISVITTKKAYEELERENFIEMISSKGCFVKKKSDSLLKEEVFKKIEESINNAIMTANTYNITKKEVIEIVNYLYEEDNNEK
jgi:GntR family transcriptional regulator